MTQNASAGLTAETLMTETGLSAAAVRRALKAYDAAFGLTHPVRQEVQGEGVQLTPTEYDALRRALQLTGGYAPGLKLWFGEQQALALSTQPVVSPQEVQQLSQLYQQLESYRARPPEEPAQTLRVLLDQGQALGWSGFWEMGRLQGAALFVLGVLRFKDGQRAKVSMQTPLSGAEALVLSRGMYALSQRVRTQPGSGQAWSWNEVLLEEVERILKDLTE